MKKLNKILLSTIAPIAAITPVVALASCNKPKSGFSITVVGADYDANASKIALDTDSTIVLKAASGYQVTSIKAVKVGDKALTSDQWYFSTANQTLLIKAVSMKSTTIYIEVGTTEALVDWVNGWYAYEKRNSGGALYTNLVDVEFDLKKEPTEDEELTFSVETTATSDNIQLKHETLSRTGKKVIIPFRLKTSYSYIEFGSYAYYDITFTCKNKTTGETSWNHTIKDCYLYLLFALKDPQAWTGSHQAGDGKADVEVNTTVNVPHKMFDDKELALKAEIVETTKRPGTSTANIQIVDGQDVPYKSDQKLYQVVGISDVAGLTAGDTFEFTIKFTVTLALFPDKPIDFTFEGVKLVFK